MWVVRDVQRHFGDGDAVPAVHVSVCRPDEQMLHILQRDHHLLASDRELRTDPVAPLALVQADLNASGKINAYMTCTHYAFPIEFELRTYITHLYYALHSPYLVLAVLAAQPVRQVFQLDARVSDQQYLRIQAEGVRVRWYARARPVVVVVAYSETQKSIVGGSLVTLERTAGQRPVQGGMVGRVGVVIEWLFPDIVGYYRDIMRKMANFDSMVLIGGDMRRT